MTIGKNHPPREREIEFWEKQISDGLLINALRTQNKRAVKFFGVDAVLREDEMRLRYVVDAHRFIITPEAELVKRANSVPLMAIERSSELDSEQRDWLRNNALCTVTDILARKEALRRYLFSLTDG